ncbi:MAG TPA: ribulose-phosphate 3-epimerase [Solirubrobacteraceae bacterium]|nr:ribulose-phosphate 3-epimerase [Solirubrobacteraceae bacterium]
MRAYVSLWSADLLDLGSAVDRLDAHVEGFHLDIMDGHFVRELLFGADTVQALSRRASAGLVDVHLMVTNADQWIAPFSDAGAQMLTVHPQSCTDVVQTLAEIEAHGVRAGLAITTDLSVAYAASHLEVVDRIVMMGTEIGIKGVDIDPDVYTRVKQLAAFRDRSARKPEIIVDGGIRRYTVPKLAEAGADGVVPGSLVFGEHDWLDGVRFIHQQVRAAESIP